MSFAFACMKPGAFQCKVCVMLSHTISPRTAGHRGSQRGFSTKKIQCSDKPWQRLWVLCFVPVYLYSSLCWRSMTRIDAVLTWHWIFAKSSLQILQASQPRHSLGAHAVVSRTKCQVDGNSLRWSAMQSILIVWQHTLSKAEQDRSFPYK